jgi:hypothetical protein
MLELWTLNSDLKDISKVTSKYLKWMMKYEVVQEGAPIT